MNAGRLRQAVFLGAIHCIPGGSLPALESLVQAEQGKGWGAATVGEEVAAALSLLPAGLRSRPVAIDAGANVGNWSAALLEAAPKAKVVAVEPSPEAAQSVERRFSGREVRVIGMALSDEDGGVQTLWGDREGSPLASLEKRRLDHFGIEVIALSEVPVTTIDSIVSKMDEPPCVIKLDVEGLELRVLEGARQTLAAKSTCVVQFEFGGCNIDSRTFFQDFWYLLKDLGFEMWRLGPRGLSKIVAYSEHDEVFTTTNFFASRDPDSRRAT